VETEPPLEGAPDSRGRALQRLALGGLVAGALLWTPAGRIGWALEAARSGVFEQAEVVELGSRALTRTDGGGTTYAVGEAETVTLGLAHRRVEVNREEGWELGSVVPVVSLGGDTGRIALAEPGAGVIGIYLGLDNWMVDLLLVPLGLLVGLVALLNLGPLLRP
jgi:hypothetical protein